MQQNLCELIGFKEFKVNIGTIRKHVGIDYLDIQMFLWYYLICLLVIHVFNKGKLIYRRSSW